MTVLLVLFTLILFLFLDHIIERRRASRVLADVAAAMETYLHIPEGFHVARNHLWMKDNGDGTTTIGVDGFLSHLVGEPEGIRVPPRGTTVAPSLPGVSLAVDGRALHLALPLSGVIVDVNPNALRQPGLLNRDPYEGGWLVRIKADPKCKEAGDRHLVGKAAEWLREQAALAKDFLSAHSPSAQLVTLQDGGVPVPGALQSYDHEVWDAFGRVFLTLPVEGIGADRRADR